MTLRRDKEKIKIYSQEAREDIGIERVGLNFRKSSESSADMPFGSHGRLFTSVYGVWWSHCREKNRTEKYGTDKH